MIKSLPLPFINASVTMVIKPDSEGLCILRSKRIMSSVHMSIMYTL